MKRIFSFLFAIITLVGTTGVFTSCQEDAPEINYTINITVNNDFTEVVNAINNGTMKQEAAIAALTAAINQMSGDQAAKLQALIDAINSLATTLDAKLAIIEAAMKAQTLALENKLALLEAAIKALPDYTDQLKAIEAAIKGMPDYSDKLAAIETALETIADNIEAQEGQYADELAALTDAIDAIQSAVAAGNTSQEAALAEIIALLKSGAIAGGGSGSGSGGEGSGDEPIGPYILLKTEKKVNSTIEFACYESELKNMSGVAGLEIIDATDGEVTKYRGILTSQEVKLYGMFTEFHCSGQKLKEIDTQKQSTVLEILMLDANPDLKFDFKSNTNLKYLDLRSKKLEISEVEDLVKKLPNRSSSGAECFAYCSWMGETINKCVKDADAKGWILHLLIP